jgi:uncharacterized lipoprotein YehR (DUF1307 family)
MKKKLKLIFLIIILILLVIIIYFFLNPIKGTVICTYTNNNSSYKISTKYKINHYKDEVLYLSTKEVITSSDTDMLEEYKSSLELLYSKYNDLEYYNNSISLNNNKLVTITNINYKKLDFNKFIELDNGNKDILVNNKVSLKKIKKIYKENGARCRNA